MLNCWLNAMKLSENIIKSLGETSLGRAYVLKFWIYCLFSRKAKFENFPFDGFKIPLLPKVMY